MSNRNFLTSIFYKLPTPESTIKEEAFSAQVIEHLSPHRIGKDVKGNPAILISTRDTESSDIPYPVILENISVRYNVLCRIIDVGKPSKLGRFIVIRCENHDKDLIEYFLRTMDVHIHSIGRDPSYKVISEMVQNLIELFHALSQPSKHSIQGLWAELLIISESSDPRFLLHSWHRDPAERYDFFAGKQRVEVKSSSGQGRIHHFSLEQLNPISGTTAIVISLFVKPSMDGLTVIDIMDSIRSQLDDDLSLFAHLYKNITITLGADWKLAASLKFDKWLAKESIHIYEVDRIPSVNMPIPLEVTEVRFKSNLSRISSCDASSLLARGGLFAAISNLILVDV